MTTFQDPHVYGNTAGSTSTVGSQIRVDYFQRKALVEAVKESYFGQLADVTAMPKNFGKTIKRFHYLPILDNRNINDQGIDANGDSLESEWVANETYAKSVTSVAQPAAEGGLTFYFEGLATAATYAAAVVIADNEADRRVYAWLVMNGYVDASSYADYATAKAYLEGLTPAWTITEESTGDEYTNYGNLYGSSKDVGTITAKIPALSETGGRVNRVGMKRIELSGTLEKFGFFDEYTQESLDFDSDADLLMHLTTESVRAANEITEDQIQIDLLTGAGTIRFAGDATSTATLGGSTAAANAEDVVVYDDLVKLAIELDNNRTPKNTKLITGSRMVDTKVVNSARYAYIGSELQPALMRMTDYHSEKAFLPVAQYGAATTLARGEFGAVGDFRFIVVPEMMHWDGAGAVVSNVADEVCIWSTKSDGSANHVNVYPILVVGDGSFTTIGFQTDGKTVKFKITHKKPGRETANRHDPYGEVGFYSIKWYYGFMWLRPERVAVLKTVATL
jgi:N4-gp56 family major capsid protein